jgi:hypothetical protein
MPEMGEEEMIASFAERLEAGCLVAFAEFPGDGFLLRR